MSIKIIEMSVVTLISDWNKGDWYIGAVKGKLLTINPALSIVDISHSIKFFDHNQAALIIKSSYNYFPIGTIHIIAVNTNFIENKNYIISKLNNHYFISADNGFISALNIGNPEISIKINLEKFKINYPESFIISFPEIMFAHIAAEMSNGKEIVEFGDNILNLKTVFEMLPHVTKNSIEGRIIYIDSYHNAISNITKEEFERYRKGRSFEIVLNSENYKITKINDSYSKSGEGEQAIFNSSGLLEFAYYFDQISEMLSLEVDTTILIKFKDSTDSLINELF